MLAKGMINIENIDTNLLTNNEYYLFYQMMYEALKYDNIVKNINKSLILLKTYLNCGDIVLHKKDYNGIYIDYIHQTEKEKGLEPISCIVNKTSPLTENKKIFYIDLGISENYKNMALIAIKTENEQYILSINNIDYTKYKNNKFLSQISDTMSIILKRAELYERNIRSINIDSLSGLKNRNSYESRIENINENEGQLIYGLFDLFRLKYINDNYGHSLGDAYIKETAKILTKYWPEYKEDNNSNNPYKKNKTGHCVYRIGGDEFVLLTNNEKIELTKIKAQLAAEEVAMMNLGVDEYLPLGLNYGITIHTPESSIREVYMDADILLSENKRKTYEKHNIERRK